jgi:hypothetical protein
MAADAQRLTPRALSGGPLSSAAHQAFEAAVTAKPGEAQAYADYANFLLNTHRFEESLKARSAPRRASATFRRRRPHGAPAGRRCGRLPARASRAPCRSSWTGA